jgi:superfamily II RNA helicase
MVKICTKTYNEQKYNEHFETFNFELSDFQKHAIEAIVTGNHVLVCCGTGNGKTLPAEFAIKYFTSINKKVIYTSPIKALSNQKYYDFKEKYPTISIGLLTGDIKINPEADVLIMTAEILQNTLYKWNKDKEKKEEKEKEEKEKDPLLAFDLNFETDLACVIHDEVHSINMEDRGHVWESIFMLLPGHVQNVMLSATLDSPEKFATWCENICNLNINIHEIDKKEVYLTTLSERVVPLTHYSFITCTQAIFKAIKDKDLEQQIRGMINKPTIIQSEKGVFDDIYFYKMKKMLSLFEQKNVHMKRSFVLNQVCKYMVEHGLLPCACFILSRKQLEIAAREITVPLLEDDSKIPYTIRRECEQILRNKIPNYQEYLDLPEYCETVSLLEKGIATHHSGTLPILKEIVEILFARGMIKLLFATETFSCGLNMPIKTVIFTDISKFDGHQFRILYGHEYIQAGGRAGRRGLDKIGHVIHLNNLFKSCEHSAYKNMMCGNPQKLTSKFKISYNLILNLMEHRTNDFSKFIDNSMIQQDIQTELFVIRNEINIVEKELIVVEKGIQYLRTDVSIIKIYKELLHKRFSTVNKKRKDIDKQIQNIETDNKYLIQDIKSYETVELTIAKIEKLNIQYKNVESFLTETTAIIIRFLEKEDFICKENECLKLTPIGFNAANLKEVNCIVFANLVDKITILTVQQIIQLFSCFTNVNVNEELKTEIIDTNDSVKNILTAVLHLYNVYQDFETENRINTGTSYLIQYDLLQYMESWINCESAAQCKHFLQILEHEKGIFLGEFVKAILKINNISLEFEKIAESTGNMELLQKLKQIPLLINKYVATNQSLYI